MSTRKRTIRPLRPVPGTDHVEVPLTKGYVAVVDAADVALVVGHNWSVSGSRNTRYAVTGPANTKSSMHRLIAGVTDPELEVHHRDSDGLNNRRANLEVLTKREHRRVTHRETKDKCHSEYTYVTVMVNAPYADGATKYRALVQDGAKPFYLGDFRDERLAAMVGDLGAQYVFDGDSYRNFPTASPEAHRHFKTRLAAFLIPRANLSSKYRGVTLTSVSKKDGSKRWAAQLLVTQSDCIKVNSVKSEEEAAWIYDALVIHFRGLGAPRNFDTLPPAYAMTELAKVLERRAGQGKSISRAA